jgi:type IV pilus assembly protein PilE
MALRALRVSFKQDCSASLLAMKIHRHPEKIPMNTPYRLSRGFTLIELMITVAIVAILTTIAYPSYRDYVIRGQLVDATQGLAALRANLERYYEDNRSYAQVGLIPPPCGLVAIPAGHFNITCVLTVTTFTATAVGATGVVQGFTYTVDQNDLEQTFVVSPPAPTSFQGCLTAWVQKTGGC